MAAYSNKVVNKINNDEKCSVYFPDELIIRILLQVEDLTTLARAMRVSRRFYQCANSITVWKRRLLQLTGWSSEYIDHQFSSSSHIDYKSMCQRFCDIFGSAPLHLQPLTSLHCPRCEGLLCDTSCVANRDEMIIFDFGSRMTWFKYVSDTTGQLSMHPTVGPIGSSPDDRFDPGLIANEFCPICTRIILRRLPSCSAAAVDEDTSHASRFSRAFSRISLKNFNCLNIAAAAATKEADIQLTEEDVESLMGASKTGVQPGAGAVNQSNSETRDSTASRLSVYKFLIKHMLKRNPFFQVQNISFVICEPLDCDVVTKLEFIKLLLCELKAPGLCFVPKPVGVALYTGLDTCLVVDSGAHNTVISPVVDLGVLTDCVQHVSVGGSHLTRALLECLQNKGMIDTEVQEGSIDSSQVKRECYVALDAQAEARKKITLRDIVVKGSRTDRQRLYEVRLSHELYQLSEDMYLHIDLPRRISQSISLLQPSLKRKLLSNIVLTGGNCRLAGLQHRLTKDLKHLLEEDLSQCVRVIDPRLMTGRSDAVIGASYVRKWGDAEWITRGDYVRGRVPLDGSLVSRRDSEDVSTHPRGSEEDEALMYLSAIGENMSEEELEKSCEGLEDDAFNDDNVCNYDVSNDDVCNNDDVCDNDDVCNNDKVCNESNDDDVDDNDENARTSNDKIEQCKVVRIV